MPSKFLSSRPSLAHLKHQAKDLLKSLKKGNPESLARVREFHPKFVDKSENEAGQIRFVLSDAQLVIAREYGFRSWPKLREHIEQSVSQDHPWYRAISKRLNALGIRMIAAHVLNNFRRRGYTRSSQAVSAASCDAQDHR